MTTSLSRSIPFVIIRHGQVLCLIDRAPVTRVYIDVFRVHCHRPEKPVKAYARIEIVDLTRLVKNIQSDKTERAVAVLPVLADILADHEAHVDFPIQ